jgi:hypothetical protein
MIGCRAPARTADKNHTRDHGHDGPTTDDNLGDACRHDHRLKGEGGWALQQPAPGVFRWNSPLGRTYHTRRQPITTDLPDPRPSPEYPDYPPPATLDEDGPILYRPPPEPGLPPRRTVDLDEPPPF